MCIQIFDDAPGGQAFLNLTTGTIVRANRALCSALGYAEAELQQFPLAAISHPDDRATEQNILAAAQSSGGEYPVGYEKRLRARSGAMVWVRIGGSVCYNRTTADNRDILTVYDITAERLSEAELRKDQALFAHLLDIAHDAIIVVDEQERIVRFNQGAERIFGYSAGEIIGGALHTLLPERFHSAHRQHVQQFARSSASARTMRDRTPIYGRRRDGTEFPAEASIAKLRSDDGMYFSVLLRDSTERIRAEQELRTAKEAAEQANRTKDEFLGIAAHDIKNPLSNIQAIASLLYDDPATGESQQEYALFIQTEAQRMFAIVTNLLSLNALDTGEFQHNMECIDLRYPLTTAVETYELRAAKKNICIHYTEPGSELPVLADSEAVVQVLDNIISNAVKYTPGGRNIYVTAERQGPHVRIVVRDEGPGLSSDDKSRLFQRFVRLSARPTGGEHSTGLGLSIVKRTVEMMNGTIRCESEPGQGASFIVELPLYQQPAYQEHH